MPKIIGEVDPQLVREVRKALGVTQEKAAELALVRLRTWQRWEGGGPIPGKIVHTLVSMLVTRGAPFEVLRALLDREELVNSTRQLEATF